MQYFVKYILSLIFKSELL